MVDVEKAQRNSVSVLTFPASFPLFLLRVVELTDGVTNCDHHVRVDVFNHLGNDLVSF